MTGKIGTIFEMDRDVMNQFSKRCVERLKNRLRFRIILSILGDLMDTKVDKEVAWRRTSPAEFYGKGKDL